MNTQLYPPITAHRGQQFATRPKFHVRADYEGHPYIAVPDGWMWDLVEYLSYHRLSLTYHFEDNGFRIVFLCQTVQAAQRLLDDWTYSSMVDEAAHLEHDYAH